MDRRKTNLAKYFPMMRTREAIIKEIEGNPTLRKKYEEWSEEERKNFLDMCTGEKGIKILYDVYFKEIMNPAYAPERMSELLSVLLGREVKVVEVLPAESRIADEESLLILDILVRTTEGNLLNCEVQKIGYKFTVARASCYSADLLLRQYKRVREQSVNRTFSYANIKDVYTIVFFEISSKVFHDFYKQFCNNDNREVLIHRMKQVPDTGIEIELLQKFIFVPLDIFKEMYQNKAIDTKLAAWLTFLSTDSPERIEELISGYPEFRPLYGDLYNMCRNVESVMDMYSKELAELDKNTVHLMIDEYREEIIKKDRELSEKDRELEEKEQELQELRDRLKQLEK